MMQVRVLVNFNCNDIRGTVAFPEGPWKDIVWYGYPGQLVEEGIFGMVGRLLRDMMPLGLTITDARILMTGGA